MGLQKEDPVSSGLETLLSRIHTYTCKIICTNIAVYRRIYTLYNWEGNHKIKQNIYEKQ